MSTGEDASAAESDSRCGCTSGGPGSAAVLSGLLLFVRRRRG
ncbi:MAG: MYXO-CTERM sorting domain-containing protein [Nannocystales bacterium]